MLKITTVILILTFLLAGCQPVKTEGPDRLYASGNYLQAYNAYKSILDNPNLLAADRRRIESRVSEILSKLSSQDIDKARSIANSARPDKISAIRQAINYLERKPNFPVVNNDRINAISGFRRDLSKLEGNITSLTRSAQLYIDDEDYRNAFVTLESLRQIGGTDLEDMTLSLKNGLLNSAQFQVEEAISDGNMNMANSVLDEVRQYGYEDIVEEIAIMLEEAKTEALLDKITEFADQQEYFKAFQLAAGQDMFERETLAEWGQFYLDQSEEFLLEEDIARAFISSYKGSQIDPESVKLRQAHNRNQASLDRIIASYIGVSSFKSPAENPSVGNRFSSFLISSLHQQLPYGIKVLDREAFDAVIEEIQVKGEGDLLNANFLLTGDVANVDIDRQNFSNNATIVVKVGEKKVPNSLYNQLIASGNYQQAQKVDQYIYEPVNQTLTYKKGEEIVKGIAGVSARLIDVGSAQTRQIIFSESISTNFEYSDKFNDEVQPANITADPLKSIGDAEITQTMLTDLTNKLSGIILSKIGNREITFAEKASVFQSRGENEGYIKSLASGVHYCGKAENYDQSVCNELTTSMLNVDLAN